LSRGLDSYLPSWLGKIHPKYATPYPALLVHAGVSLILVILNFTLTGSGVQETFQKLLSLAVVLQLIPFLYMFGALLKIGFDEKFVRGHYGRGMLLFAGVSGMLTTILGIALAFFPGAADHFTAFLRNMDVWRDAWLHRTGGVFLFLCMGAGKRRANWQKARRRREIRSWRKAMSSPAKPAVKTYQNYVNGQWVSSSTGETFPVFDPSTEEVIANVAAATASDVDKAVKASRAAFDSGPWPATMAQDRGRILFKLAEKDPAESADAGGTGIAQHRQADCGSGI